MDKSAYIGCLRKTLSVDELQAHPELESQLAEHLRCSPEDNFLDLYQVFESAGVSGELMFVLYDVITWQNFVNVHVDTLREMGWHDSERVACVGSSLRRHTLPRVAYAAPATWDSIGLQNPFSHVLELLTKTRIEWIICYGGFLDMLRAIPKQQISKLRVRGILTTTEGVTSETRSWIEKYFGCRVRGLLSATEIGVFGVECLGGAFHVPVGVRMISNSHEITFDNTLNQVQRFHNYRLPIHIKKIVSCSCGDGEAFSFRGGRSAQVAVLDFSDGRVTPVHSIAIRSALDELPSFPGARIKLNVNRIEIEIVSSYPVSPVEEAVIKVLMRHGISEQDRSLIRLNIECQIH